MLPLIGVTCSADEAGRPVPRPFYLQAVLAAGGLPVSLPFVGDERAAEAVLCRIDGVVLSGSEDLDPTLWDEARHPATELMHPARQRAELAYARAIWRQRHPALGICGGLQTLNVAAGGSLVQHLPDVPGALPHQDPTWDQRHEVAVEAGTHLARLIGAQARVNTSHHQAVGRVGEGLVVSARSPDGCIEACEAPDRPFLLGVQWHPERMLGEPGQVELFRALVSAARDA